MILSYLKTEFSYEFYLRYSSAHVFYPFLVYFNNWVPVSGYFGKLEQYL